MTRFRHTRLRRWHFRVKHQNTTRHSTNARRENFACGLLKDWLIICSSWWSRDVLVQKCAWKSVNRALPAKVFPYVLHFHGLVTWFCTVTELRGVDAGDDYAALQTRARADGSWKTEPWPARTLLARLKCWKNTPTLRCARKWSARSSQTGWAKVLNLTKQSRGSCHLVLQCVKPVLFFSRDSRPFTLSSSIASRPPEKIHLYFRVDVWVWFRDISMWNTFDIYRREGSSIVIWHNWKFGIFNRENLSTASLVCFIGMRGICHVFALFVVMWACLCSQVTAGPDCPYGWVKQGRSCYFAATAWTRYVDLYVAQESRTTLNGSSHGMW